MTSQTAFVVKNATNNAVKVYLTLGATAGCVKTVADVSFVTNHTPKNPLQGWFSLPANSEVTYTSPSGVGFDGNFSFGSAPTNNPTDEYLSGVNLAEFIVNNSFQPGTPQETIDISAVYGVNAHLRFSMSGGGTWNAGPLYPNVSAFENGKIEHNLGKVGVFPYGCTGCISTTGFAPPSPLPLGAPKPPVTQAQPICNVQRDASAGGGTVTLIFLGFYPQPA